VAFVRSVDPRALYLRALGAVSLLAFLSLGVQVRGLIGADGLLPLEELLRRAEEVWGSSVGLAERMHRMPMLFWFGASDALLLGACVAGALLSLGLTLLVAPRICIAGAWVLYLSLTVACNELLAFQWDSLLIQTLFFSWLYAPRGLLPFRSPPPPAHPAARALLVALLFLLHFESGIAKLVGGDPGWSWREPSALIAYYETAPIPTWLGWYAHQLPRSAHLAAGWWTLFAELLLPFALFAPWRLRRWALLGIVCLHAPIALTANYGFFNLLSVVLCIPALPQTDTAAAPWRASWFGSWRHTATTAACGALLALSLLAFAVGILRWSAPEPLRRIVEEGANLRTINVYHLFVHMTERRPELVFEWSDDGTEWRELDMLYKPGDPRRAPPFVAPHQPRVDFRLWFYALRPQSGPLLGRLAAKLRENPQSLAWLFTPESLPPKPPKLVRVGLWTYHMTDFATRSASGLWWDRTLERYLR